MAENIGAEIRRDTALEQRILEAVIADRNAQPRSQQLQVGPSQVGGCRELLRAGLFESDSLAEPETNYAAAAHVGSVMGAEYERILGERIDVLTQQRITAMFGALGVQISGATDLLFIQEDQISDLKSSDDIGGVLYDLKRNASAIETLLAIRKEGLLFHKHIETPDGGYELTEMIVSKVAKLHYYVQIAIYIIGAIQQGILTENATGRLVFYDRSGNYQGFVALVVTSEEVDLFYDIAQARLQQVVEGQMAYEGTGGNPAVIAHLRDMAPSYCFSPKVMCPRRMHCWAGSEWANDNRITNPDHVAAVNRYIVGRDLEKLGKGMKMSAREDLKEVTGMLPDGKMVTWGGNGAINVVETTVAEPQTQARLDQYVPPVDVAAEVAAERQRAATGADTVEHVGRAMRQRELEKLSKPELLAIAVGDYDLEPKGVKAAHIQRILDHEFSGGDTIERDTRTSEQVAADVGEFLAQPMDALDDGPEFDTPQPVDEPVDIADQAMLGGPEGDEAADLLQQAGPVVARTADGETRPTGVHFEDSEILKRRQELYGYELGELEAVAAKHDLAINVPRNFMVQAILDAEFQPVVGRGWKPNGEGTSGDPTTDRLRDMQYNADTAMRRNYEGGRQ